MNETIQTILGRSSLRKYADEPVTDEELNLILQSAMRAPTSSNLMLYSIIHVTDQAKKEALVDTCHQQRFIAKAPVVLLFVADFQRLSDYFDAHGVRALSAPKESELVLAMIDTIAAAENAVIAGESLGIGSCYIGYVLDNYQVHKEMFQLPELVFPMALLTMGHIPEGYERPRTTRYAQDLIVFENDYQRLPDEELRRMFADSEAVYNEKARQRSFAEVLDRRINQKVPEEMRASVRSALQAWRSE